MTEQELMVLDKPIARFDAFRSELAELKKINEQAVFDYESPAGNKEARSHVYKLRQSKAAVDRARKKEKEIALEYGRKVDSEAKEIIGEIEGMIEVHAKPIEEIEQREKDRIADLKERIAWMRNAPATASQAGLDPDSLRQTIGQIEGTDPDDFAEFKQEAWTTKENALAALKDILADTEKRIAEREELERLRAEREEREKREREDQIRREAEEKARKEADAARQREIEEAREREREAVLAKERAEQREREAAERAKREAAEEAERKERERLAAERAEKERLEREEAERQAAEEKRRADENLREKVRGEIQHALCQVVDGLPPTEADELALALMRGDVPYCKVDY